MICTPTASKTPEVCGVYVCYIQQSQRSSYAGIGWPEELKQQTLAGNLKKAVQYARKQQPHMENYLLDPWCQIFNNLAENATHPFTVGCKNWLFSDTVKGARASAVIYSLVETAGANSLSKRGYLHIVLSNRKRLMKPRT